MCEDYVDKLVALANAAKTGDAQSLGLAVGATGGGGGDDEVMPLDVVYGIFGNIREIYKIHARFFDGIKVGWLVGWSVGRSRKNKPALGGVAGVPRG